VGLIVLDAGVLIAVLDATDAHHVAATMAVRAALSAAHRLVLPASAYAEVMVAPSTRGSDAMATVDAFVDALPAAIEPATREVAVVAATLRSSQGPRLRLPDALVVATAMVLGAERVLTTDSHWPRLQIPVEVIAGKG
jgi:predicted nucleic acid-binding protein